MSQECDLVTQSQSRIKEVETKDKEDKDQLATCNANIIRWTQPMDELH